MKKFKKIQTLMIMALVALVSMTVFTSCDPDDDIAYDLDGVWRGNMYISHSYSGRVYDSTYSEIEFISNGSFSSSGRGYWVDYYSNAPWDYIYNDIRWSVDRGVIKVYFVQEDTYVYIDHYTLTNRYFDGSLDDNGTFVQFRLNRVSAPRDGSWDRYSYWDDDYYYGYYSKGSRADSGNVEKPQRSIRVPEK